MVIEMERETFEKWEREYPGTVRLYKCLRNAYWTAVGASVGVLGWAAFSPDSFREVCDYLF